MSDLESDSGLSKLTPLKESTDDSHETRMAYTPGTNLPWYVVAVWTCVLVGLGGYFFLHYLRDLKAWGAP